MNRLWAATRAMADWLKANPMPGEGSDDPYASSWGEGERALASWDEDRTDYALDIADAALAALKGTQ